MSKFLRRRAHLIGKATASGKLYDLGMYPGFVTAAEGVVQGELYRINEENAEETMQMLDAYESVTGAPEDEYKRIEVSVHVSDGGKFNAYTYEYSKATDALKMIPMGNYAAYYPGKKDHERFVNGE